MSLAATSQPLNKSLHIKYIQDLDKVCRPRSGLTILTYLPTYNADQLSQ